MKSCLVSWDEVIGMSSKKMQMSEKRMVSDLVYSQAMISAGYNRGACECVNAAIKAELINILNEEQQVHQELFAEMLKRGWYQPEQAAPIKVAQAKQMYGRM